MYQSFQSFQSFLGFLFACFTVYTVIKALNLDHLLDPFRDLWERLSKTGRILTTVSVVFLAGYAISKERGVRNLGPNLPDWFVALNYNTADTDGDGIPDCWERWTRTNPLVADAEQDRDGDGVDNFGEFWNQCDPLMKDTDGDGYSDKLEIEGKAAGKTWFDPIVRASYDYNDPDCNTNGVPDRWEGLGYVYGYTDANSDGLPDGVPFPESGNGTFDVEVIVSTTRAALLSWGPSTNEAIVLPPCSCLPVRLRLSGYADTDVRLSCGTAGDGSEGLWYGRLVIRWPEGSEQETEGDRIRMESDAVIECEAMEVSFRGEVQTEPTRTPGDVPTSITSPFRRKWINVFGISGGCWEHDTNGVAAVAFYTNVAPPFVWFFGDGRVDGYHNDYLPIGAFPTNEEGDVQVSCEWVGGTPHQTIRVIGSTSFRLDHCPSDTTNIIGAAWSSTHSHTNSADHVPYHHAEDVFRYGPNCPMTRHHTYCVGWDHTKVNTRNLVPILDSEYVDHCLGIEGALGTTIDFTNYLSTSSLEVLYRLRFSVNGKVLSQGLHTDTVSRNPTDLNPCILLVTVLNDQLEPLDHLWIVVYSTRSKEQYDKWKNSETNLTWTTMLPKPFASLGIATNSMGHVKPVGTNAVAWKKPESMGSSSYMHHNAVTEMRSFAVSGGHGHQATYDDAGCLIVQTIAAGTSDKVSPASLWDGSITEHRNQDVTPYIRALQIDGNPILTDNATGLFPNGVPTRFTRPCIFQGNETDAYLIRRPPTPTGVQY